ncbi:MAG: hypothetical protein COB66_01315 [Coxiella sp. (in: Bacteria)]|nr:MAG: hypothetical protein COB66_01315 [Coxiella sp. (in: g-proteobacteria)]
MAIFNFGAKASAKTTGREEREIRTLRSAFQEVDAQSTIGREKLNIDQAGIDKLIGDVLGGADGLASIFGGEQTAGIFSSSVSAQAAGDLATKLVGELAVLTAERVTTQDTVGVRAGTSTEDEKTTKKSRETEFATETEGSFGI